MINEWALLLTIVCVIQALLAEPATNFAIDDDDACVGTICGPGRECFLMEDGQPSCRCRGTCPSHLNTVCGSDGESYDNHCELHKAACATGTHIHVKHDGLCKKKETVTEVLKTPLACFQMERDQLRFLMVQWLKRRAMTEQGEKDYIKVVEEQFHICDVSKNKAIDAVEFLECIDYDENEASKYSTSMSQESGSRLGIDRILKGLCVDSLIGMVDENEDWLLDWDEFQKGMEPHYKPVQKNCSLEEDVFQDGSEAKLGCNICVCACGSWVCTNAENCPELDDPHILQAYEVSRGGLPSNEERLSLLKGFKFMKELDSNDSADIDLDNLPDDFDWSKLGLQNDAKAEEGDKSTAPENTNTDNIDTDDENDITKPVDFEEGNVPMGTSEVEATDRLKDHTRENEN
ncbi:unnamed protein product [Owenia fusiformis]|uniref:Uncharacterized protein n=1 Tax=Owenia fusiformis TaxID=6347 RepID=A0A8J1TZA1_OWEFU|nr:unnamed protein product [Owenia fusiformis]